MNWFKKQTGSRKQAQQPSRWAGFKAFWLGGHDEQAVEQASDGVDAPLPPRASGFYLAGAVVMLIATVIAWPHLEQALADHLREQQALRGVQADRAGVVRVELLNTPSTMSPLLRQRVAETVAHYAGADPLDQRGLTYAAAALQDSPWVRQVRSVRRASGNRVQVDAVFRQPVAVVRGLDGYHLVDGECVRLPGLYLKHQLRYLDLPVITGVSQAPPPEGAVWSGDDLRAGLALAAIVGREPYAEQIVSYDVSDRDTLGRLRLRLITESGMVRWGLPPGQERGLEPDSETKRRWLASVERRRGSIDAGGRIVDVYGAAVYVYDWASQSQRPVAAMNRR